MKKVIYYIKKGSKDHPGTDVLWALTVFGLLIGAKVSSSFSGSILCGAIMLGFAGIPWLIGAYEIGVANEDNDYKDKE